MAPLLALPLAAGSVIALPAASAAAASCAQMNFTNPYWGYSWPVPTATLSDGSNGPCVVLLQQDLNFVLKEHLSQDGKFGPNTLEAVEDYQGNIPACTRGVDGIAGHYTMSCLGVQAG
jgi:hypothetical protein